MSDITDEPKNAVFLVRNNPNEMEHKNQPVLEHMSLSDTVFPLRIVHPCAHLQQGQSD